MSFLPRCRLYGVDCDVSHVRRAELASVEAMARAYVNALRLGSRIRFVNASPALEELIALVGLDGVLLGCLERQPEQREETLGVEERVEPDDPSV
jgi:anti-anti-sigma regulatory factor